MARRKSNQRAVIALVVVGLFAFCLAGAYYAEKLLGTGYVSSLTSLLAAPSAASAQPVSVYAWVKGKSSDTYSKNAQVPDEVLAEFGYVSVNATKCELIDNGEKNAGWSQSKTSGKVTNVKLNGDWTLNRVVRCSNAAYTSEDVVTIVVGLQCASTDGKLSAGGSNYTLSSIGKLNSTNNLRDPAVKPPFIEYLTDPKKIKSQLTQMYDDRQRKITVFIWHAPFTGANVDALNMGYLVNSKGGLKPDAIKGLKGLFGAIKDTKFEEVTIRFGLQSCAHPEMWTPQNTINCPTAYSPEIEAENWKVIQQVRSASESVFGNTSVKRWYDLGVELPGGTISSQNTYIQNIWKRYTDAYGTDDTYGFSIAYADGRITKAYAIYDAVGKRPAGVAVDVYDRYKGGPSMESMLTSIGREMAALSITDHPLIIQETYYNDAASYAQIAKAIRTANLPIHAIYAWPEDKNGTYHAPPKAHATYCPAIAAESSKLSVFAWIQEGMSSKLSKNVTVKTGSTVAKVGFYSTGATSCRIFNNGKEYTAWDKNQTQRVGSPYKTPATPWTLVQTIRCSNGKETVEDSVTIVIQ